MSEGEEQCLKERELEWNSQQAVCGFFLFCSKLYYFLSFPGTSG